MVFAAKQPLLCERGGLCRRGFQKPHSRRGRRSRQKRGCHRPQRGGQGRRRAGRRQTRLPFPARGWRPHGRPATRRTGVFRSAWYRPRRGSAKIPRRRIFAWGRTSGRQGNVLRPVRLTSRLAGTALRAGSPGQTHYVSSAAAFAAICARYCLGEMPYSFLKARKKLEYSAKPHRSYSACRVSPSPMRVLAQIRRR